MLTRFEQCLSSVITCRLVRCLSCPFCYLRFRSLFVVVICVLLFSGFPVLFLFLVGFLLSNMREERDEAVRFSVLHGEKVHVIFGVVKLCIDLHEWIN